MIDYVVWDKGKPVSTNSKEEADRINKRILIIDKVLKEMGYSEGYTKYQEYVTDLVKTDFNKYMELLDRVKELSEGATTK